MTCGTICNPADSKSLVMESKSSYGFEIGMQNRNLEGGLEIKPWTRNQDHGLEIKTMDSKSRGLD